MDEPEAPPNAECTDTRALAFEYVLIGHRLSRDHAINRQRHAVGSIVMGVAKVFEKLSVYTTVAAPTSLPLSRINFRKLARVGVW